MTIRSQYRLSPELEERDVQDAVCHLDICIIGLDWDWDELAGGKEKSFSWRNKTVTRCLKGELNADG